MNRKAWMSKKTGALVLGVAVVLAVLLLAARPLMAASSYEERFVTWEDTGKKGEVGVTLCIQKEDDLEDVVTFSIPFYLTGEGIESASFQFDKELSAKKSGEVPVQEAIYDSEAQTLTVYVSGREQVLNKTALRLGTIRVKSDKNVEISVPVEECVTVNKFHIQRTVGEMGGYEPYVMLLEEEETEPSTSEETTTTEAVITTSADTSGTPADTDTTSAAVTTEDTDDEEGTYSPKSAVMEQKGTWDKSGNAWIFRKEDGSYAKEEWAFIQGAWYRFGPDGKMQTGWILDRGVWYYCAPSGSMKSGWIWDQDRWYYCAPSGGMKTGWVEDKTYWYYMDESGAMKTNWVEIGGKWYYFDETGRMAVDTVTPDGKRVDRNGVRTE